LKKDSKILASAGKLDKTKNATYIVTIVRRELCSAIQPWHCIWKATPS